MGTSREYVVAVAFLLSLALVFGVLGTVAPPLAEEGAPIQPQQESSSESVGHFKNPPSYDSGWVNMTDKAGKHVTLTHGLNRSSSEMFVDISGKESLTLSSGVVEWAKSYGGTQSDEAWDSVQTEDGFALIGSTDPYGSDISDFSLIKTDTAGTKLWNRTYGGSGADYAHSLIQTSDGGYAMAGYTNSFGAGNNDFWLIRTDGYGNMLWNRTYGGALSDIAYSLIQTNDDGYALVGASPSFSPNLDVWLVKTDASGEEVWNETYGGSNKDYGCSVIQLDDGSYVIAADTYSYGAGSADFWLLKTDASGNKLWDKTYGGTYSDNLEAFAKTFDGGYVLCGSTNSYGAANPNFWLVEANSTGDMRWSRAYGGVGSDAAFSVVQTGDGCYVLAGQTDSSGAGGYDLWLMKANASGTQLWSKTYGGANNDGGRSIIHTSDGGYSIAGYSSSFSSGSKDMWLVKLRVDPGLDQRSVGETTFIPGWRHTYDTAGGEEPAALIQTQDGGFAMMGSNPASDVLLFKTDAQGNIAWNKTYSGLSQFVAHSIVQASDGGYTFAAGYRLFHVNAMGDIVWNTTHTVPLPTSMIQTSDGGYAIFGHNGAWPAERDLRLCRTDSSGNLLWNRTLGHPFSLDEGYALVQTADGGFALAGTTAVAEAHYLDFLLMKTDSSGIQQWNKTFGGVNYEEAYAMVMTSDGGFVLAGSTGPSGEVNHDVWLVGTDSLGNMIWSRKYGGFEGDYARSLIQTSDGGFALLCDTDYYVGSTGDMWLIKTDSTGNMQWTKVFGASDSIEMAKSFTRSNDGAFVLLGLTSGDFWLVKTDVDSRGITLTSLTDYTITVYRDLSDIYWNYMRVRIWAIEEPSWIYGDVNMDGTVDTKDLYIVGRNYGKTFSLLSLSGIAAVAGIRTVKKRKQTKQPSYIS